MPSGRQKESPRRTCPGSAGAISVTANILPDKVSRMIEAWRGGDAATAQKIHYELLEFNQVMFVETNPIPVKTALAMMGKIKEEFKLPLCEMTDANKAKLSEVLKKYECI